MQTLAIYRALCDLQNTSASLSHFDPHDNPTRKVLQVFAEHQVCPRHCSRAVVYPCRFTLVPIEIYPNFVGSFSQQVKAISNFISVLQSNNNPT